MTPSHRHIEKAKTDLSRATSFELIVETSTGTIEYTAAVDENTYPSGRTAAHKRVWLLGQHIHCLAAELGGSVTPEQAANLALEATESGDQTDDSGFVFR